MCKYVLYLNVKQDFITDYELNKIFLYWYIMTKQNVKNVKAFTSKVPYCRYTTLTFMSYLQYMQKC